MIHGRTKVLSSALMAQLVLVLSGLSPNVHAESACSSQAILGISQAIELFDRKEFLDDTNDLCSVIKQEPDCAEALWVQSFIDFCLTPQQYGDPEILRPAEMKRRALELNPHLAENWSQAQALDLPDLRTQTFDHFEIRYFRAEDRDLAWETNGYLSDIYNEMSSAFGIAPETPFRVILYTPEVLTENWRNVSLGGFFNLGDRTLRLRAGDDKDPEQGLRLMARREYARAFWSTLGLHGVPGWMREGTADFYSHYDSADGYWKDNRLEVIRNHFKQYGHTDVTLNKMETLYLNKKIVTTLGKYEAYLQAEAMVLQIAKERGDSWIPQVVQAMRSGKSWTAAYQDVVGVPPQQVLNAFQKSWKESGDQSTSE